MQSAVCVGEELSVAFRLPFDEREPIQAACKVVWTGHAGETRQFPRFCETGLFLVEISDEHRERIAVFVEAQVDRR
jgi:hypothetical protein